MIFSDLHLPCEVWHSVESFILETLGQQKAMDYHPAAQGGLERLQNLFQVCGVFSYQFNTVLHNGNRTEYNKRTAEHSPMQLNAFHNTPQLRIICCIQ